MDDTVFYAEVRLTQLKEVHLQFHYSFDQGFIAFVSFFHRDTLILELKSDLKTVETLANIQPGKAFTGRDFNTTLTFKREDRHVIIKLGASVVILSTKDSSWSLFSSKLKEGIETYRQVKAEDDLPEPEEDEEDRVNKR